MHKRILFFLIFSFTSQAQFLKLSTLTATGNFKGAYASLVIGQSSVAAGTTSQARQGFKQPLGSKQAQRMTSMLSVGEPMSWSVETFPNPFVDKLTVKLYNPSNLPTRLLLYDMSANLIWEDVYDEKHTEIDLKHLKDIRAGKYLLQIFHHGKPQTKTLIKAIQ